MEAELFGILKLSPGFYSPDQIVERHRSVRSQILRDGGPDRQRRLDDALIACLILQDSRKQAELLNRVNRDACINAQKVKLAARQSGSKAANHGRAGVRRPVKHLRPIEIPAARSRGREVETSVGGDSAKRFAAMVASAVENGVLRMSARLDLLERAKALKIPTFKANLVIAEVLHDMSCGWQPEGVDPLAGKSDKELRGNYVAQASASHRRYGLRIVAAIMAAAAIDMLIFMWLW